VGANIRVLIVDDEELIRASVGMCLELYGFSVASAINATEAIEKIGTQTFDVLLSDLRMPPPGDGYSVITAMQSASPACITILMSAHLILENEDMIRPRPNYILRKPLEIPSLISLIKDAIDQRSHSLTKSSLEITTGPTHTQTLIPTLKTA
jgi:DNA-binding NtrC family response regulator